jgi:dipeptidyl aminopeptidase/acylaminoacyl peptidase
VRCGMLGLALASGWTLSASDPCDGTALDIRSDVSPTRDYADYVRSETEWYRREREGAEALGLRLPPEDSYSRSLLSAQEYAMRARHDGFMVERVAYASDGLRVTAYIFRPQRIERTLPAIIFNRGGNREFGRLGPADITDFYPYLAAGFVVIGSQYRGNDGGEGREEFGGADVDDVMNLIPLARNLGYIDMQRIGMLGCSRGGMMTYLAMKRGISIRAAAVIGAPADEEAEAIRRPMLGVYHDLVPGFARDPQGCYRERSALRWPERLRAPLLILHGTADWRVDPQGSVALAERLAALGRPCRLVLVSDDHALDLHRAEKEQVLVSWFQQQMPDTSQAPDQLAGLASTFAFSG